MPLWIWVFIRPRTDTKKTQIHIGIDFLRYGLKIKLDIRILPHCFLANGTMLQLR